MLSTRSSLARLFISSGSNRRDPLAVGPLALDLDEGLLRSSIGSMAGEINDG
jgi:hypothetical protein